MRVLGVPKRAPVCDDRGMDRADDKPDKGVYCRRINRLQTVDEHKTCPYCFGRRADVAQGDHEQFCDFEPGVDPIVFGFPPDAGRMAKVTCTRW
jgi:hypothetical protein